MRSQECGIKRCSFKAKTQSPYQTWLARKVEEAVERALELEGQRVLEEYAASRKWVLPETCEERRLVTRMTHSLLLQWRPDFSAEWSLKLRRALPILEVLFIHMASSIDDFSNPLLIEPRLKRVLSLLDCSDNNKSPPPRPSQSSSNHTLPNYLHCFHNPCHSLFSVEHIEAVEQVCSCKTCLCVFKGSPHHDQQEACLCRLCLSADKGGLDVKGHEGCVFNLDGERLGKRSQKVISCICVSCLSREEGLSLEEGANTKAHIASLFGSCVCVTDELDEGNLDDSLQWSKTNLPSRGTVATLMASELRRSRKEEANQALWNALASKEVSLLKDNLHKHGEFASKPIVKKIMAILKRSKKEEKQFTIKKVLTMKLLHAASEEQTCRDKLSTFKMSRSLRKGLFGLFSCHTAAAEEAGLPADPASLPIDFGALESNHPCHLLGIDSTHSGGSAEKTIVDRAEIQISSSSNMLSLASSIETSTDDDDDDDGSFHNYTEPFLSNPIDEMHPAIINGSEKLLWSSQNQPDDWHSRMLSGDVLVSQEHVEVGVTSRLTSSSNECFDVQINSGVNTLKDGNGVVHSDLDSRGINSANEDFGHTYLCDLGGASTRLCVRVGDCESHSGPSEISHSSDDECISHLTCRSSANDQKEIPCLIGQRRSDRTTNGQMEERFMLEEADTSGKERSEALPNCLCSLEESPCMTRGDSEVNKSFSMIKPLSTKSFPSDMNCDDQKLAEANMQSGSPHEENENQEGTGPSRNISQGSDEDESGVSGASVEVHTRYRDEETEGEGGRQRPRVPLSSLLAQRDDWNSQSIVGSSAWRGACPWDTWEEPNEALDPLCCVCMIGLKGAAFTPCGHTFCRKCSRELWKGRGMCPLCNKLITGILDIF